MPNVQVQALEKAESLDAYPQHHSFYANSDSLSYSDLQSQGYSALISFYNPNDNQLSTNLLHDYMIHYPISAVPRPDDQLAREYQIEFAPDRMNNSRSILKPVHASQISSRGTKKLSFVQPERLNSEMPNELSNSYDNLLHKDVKSSESSSHSNRTTPNTTMEDGDYVSSFNKKRLELETIL